MASTRPHYGPPDASRAPRYTGIRTFNRCPLSSDWENADVAVIGVPFDTATSMRPGPRFGPAAIRDQSLLIRPWHTAHAIDVFATLSVVDGGDIDVLDPAFAPGTGTPEIAGLLPHEAVAFLRALAGVRFTGFDVVEVSPPYDGPGQVTALNGASIGFECLALCAVAAARRDG